MREEEVDCKRMLPAARCKLKHFNCKTLFKKCKHATSFLTKTNGGKTLEELPKTNFSLATRPQSDLCSANICTLPGLLFPKSGNTLATSSAIRRSPPARSTRKVWQLMRTTKRSILAAKAIATEATEATEATKDFGQAQTNKKENTTQNQCSIHFSWGIPNKRAKVDRFCLKEF